MSPVLGGIKIIVGILGWIFLIALVLAIAGVAGTLLSDWYYRLRYRRRERAAQASTLRARRDRQFRAGRPMGALHPDHGSAMSQQERDDWAEIKNHLSSEGRTP